MKIKDIYENIIVMMYIIILTIATAVIILYSRDIYSKVNAYTLDFQNLEVAMSYVNVKVRQKDKSGVISVKPIESLDENALVFTEDETATWIFEYENKLIEEKTKKGEQPTFTNYITIAEIEDFEVNLKDKLLEYDVVVNEKLKDRTVLNIRSDY